MPGTEVLLIDYHQSHLVPFGDGTGGPAVTVNAHPAGQADASMRLVRDNDHLFLPLAVYGERELLPGRTCASEEFSLAGQLEPAYTVSGDSFDWSLSRQYLTVSVSAGMSTSVQPIAAASGNVTGFIRPGGHVT